MMRPSYVENDSFSVVDTRQIGCLGRRLLLRQYRLRANPDQRASDISYSVVASWAMAGMPKDAVFHLGDFYRVTVL